MFVYENGVFTAVPCTKKNSYLSIRDFAEGRDGTIYVASPSGVCRVRSGLLVPYSNPYITGETAYALGIDRYGRLWCGTYSELGLVRYDTGGGELTFFNQSNGLGST